MSGDTDELVRGVEAQWEAMSGRERLSCWFSLSYAAWLTMPRVLMEAMPDDRQKRMAVALEEFSEQFPDWSGGMSLYITAKKDGQFTSLPFELCNYRHPDPATIGAMRKKDAA